MTDRPLAEFLQDILESIADIETFTFSLFDRLLFCHLR